MILLFCKYFFLCRSRHNSRSQSARAAGTAVPDVGHAGASAVLRDEEHGRRGVGVGAARAAVVQRAARAPGRVLRAVAPAGARAQAHGGAPGAGLPGPRRVLLQLHPRAAPAALPHARGPPHRRHAARAHQGAHIMCI